MIILEKAVKGVSATSLARFARRAQRLAGFSGEVNVLVSGNSRLRELNRRFRKKDRPTDVLSFSGDGVGDIAISAELARRNAARYRHSPADELKILVLHGMLHLAGYDHERDHGGMAALENRLRVRLELPTSLISRTRSNALHGFAVSRNKPKPRRRSR